MELKEIRLRDPFILPYSNEYYMYGSRSETSDEKKTQLGCDVYKSRDLKQWSDAKRVVGQEKNGEGEDVFWAPEIHIYQDKFYMFVTLKKANKCRGTYIFVSDTPDGEFQPHSIGSITPSDWECLDGTLYMENDIPYMVFCHEWLQVHDGEICAVELSQDLKRAVGEPKLLFKGSDVNWVRDMKAGDYITDGCFLFKEDGILYMLWSSFDSNGYVQALAYSKSGDLFGEWKHNHELLYDKDGGHGMLFNDFKNNRRCVLHTQNCSEVSIPAIYDFVKKDICEYELKQI